jgi:7,8-dihydropterin-6-yl-methyl-4-(beta-D-ribofuranosyl)aminobenzene 5'-phosphate synthase
LEGLREIDSLEVIAVADNSYSAWTDPERKDVQRYFKWVQEEKEEDRPYLVAGCGLSLHLRTKLNNETYTILYDAAENPRNMENNIAALGLKLEKVDAIVMSHGHYDHFGGLLWTIRNIGRKDLPVYVHPWMFYKKGFEMKKPEGSKLIELDPMPSADEIAQAGGNVISSTEPILLENGMLLRTGEVPRVTVHEKGMEGHKVFMDGKWQDDAAVRDDVSLVANVKGKGLVVISGCSHAGIINIIREAQRLTGIDLVHAVIGGFHLARGVTKDTMRKTVEVIKKIHPKLLVPCHCTGWRARHMMSGEMPSEYVEGSVGHKYIIGEGDVS